MLPLSSAEIRERFQVFFEKRGHKRIPSAPIIPQEDASTLFIGSGMQPLVPYLLGQTHPEGTRLTNSQKCVRTQDIMEVGDNIHDTFFEMMGNWSLGDFFKKEMIPWIWEFLTSPREGLGIPAGHLVVSVFKTDNEAYDLWWKVLAKDFSDENARQQRIVRRGRADNWWSMSTGVGPQGPDSEIFAWARAGTNPVVGDLSNDDAGWVEIWNSVFMQVNVERLREVVLIDAVHALIDKKTGLNKQLASALADLPVKVIVVTNAPAGDIKKHLKGYDFEIFTRENKPAKKNTDYFKQLITEFCLDAAGTVYVDHSQENLNAARASGINGQLFISNKEAIAYVKKMTVRQTDLAKKNIDTGAGLERLVMITQEKTNIFETDLFQPVMEVLKHANWGGARSNSRADEGHKHGVYRVSPLDPEYSYRVIADHLRTAAFMIANGVLPSNVGRGYVLRRLIRRAVHYGNKLGFSKSPFTAALKTIPRIYGNAYPELSQKSDLIIAEVTLEAGKFEKTIAKGLKELDKIISHGKDITGKDAFGLYSTYGLPLEMTQEVLAERRVTQNLTVKNPEGFQKALDEHQQASKGGVVKTFASGLADTDPKTVRSHTATHLMHEALRKVLGEHVHQKGSNITPQRLRFDFTHDQKMTDEQKMAVEKWVNDVIAKNMHVVRTEISAEEAKKQRETGAIGLFDQKYQGRVSIYTVGDLSQGEEVVSKEFCSGPHVERTGDIGHFKIKKEESSSSGVRRIKAVLE